MLSITAPSLRKQNLGAEAETSGKARGYFPKSAVGVITETARLLFYQTNYFQSNPRSPCSSLFTFIWTILVQLPLYSQALPLISLLAGVLGNVFLLKNTPWKMFCCKMW